MIVWMSVGYMWLYVHRPFEVWPVLGSIRLEFIYMICLTLVWLASPKSVHLNRATAAIAVFAGTVLISWAASKYSVECEVNATNWFKLLPFYLIMITSIRNESDLKKVLIGFVVVMFLYMGHSYNEYLNGRHVYRMGIPRMVGVDASLGDPNAFAASIVYALPMILLFWPVRTSRKQTYAILAWIVLAVTCILLTGSRTGLIGIIGFALMWLMTSRRRGIVLLMIAIAGPLIWIALPEDIQTRYMTIIEDDVGPRSAQQSKEGRSLGFYKSVDLWEEKPLLGHGPGAFGLASGWNVQSHILYGQVISELGILGIFSLLGLIACICLNYFEARQLIKVLPEELRDKNFCYLLNRSVMFSLVLLLLLGFGGHNLFRFTWIWYAAFQGLSLTFLRRQAEEYEHERDSAWRPESAPVAASFAPRY